MAAQVTRAMKMKKRWTIQPSSAPAGTPMSVEARLENYGPKPTFRERRRIRKAVNQAIGRAMAQHGAARNSAMRKLARLPLDNIVSEETLAVLRDPKWQPKPRAKKEKTDAQAPQEDS